MAPSAKTSMDARSIICDGSGAAFAVIIGDDEASTGEVQLKSLREDGVAQRKLKVDELADAIIDTMIDSEDTGE